MFCMTLGADVADVVAEGGRVTSPRWQERHHRVDGSCSNGYNLQSRPLIKAIDITLVPNDATWSEPTTS